MNRVSVTRQTTSYKTKDNSEIRELIHPTHNSNNNQSIAEARVQEGEETTPHYHRISEEIYLTTGGTGKLYLQKEGEEMTEITLKEGVNAVILAGEIHWLKNTGEGDLTILCCCSPPYSHQDTVLTPHKP